MRRRKQIRLRKYDYSMEGTYFITICTKDREELFGKIVDGEILTSRYGKIVLKCWKELPEHYPNIMLDEFVIMPNHVHGIITIFDYLNTPVGAIHELPLQNVRRERRQMLLPKIIGRFKQNSAKQINIYKNTQGEHIWQRGYYEHIVRTEKSLNRIREYIRTNPERWEWDKENPECKEPDDFDAWLKKEGVSHRPKGKRQ